MWSGETDISSSVWSNGDFLPSSFLPQTSEETDVGTVWTPTKSDEVGMKLKFVEKIVVAYYRTNLDLNFSLKTDQHLFRFSCQDGALIGKKATATKSLQYGRHPFPAKNDLTIKRCWTLPPRTVVTGLTRK